MRKNLTEASHRESPSNIVKAQSKLVAYTSENQTDYRHVTKPYTGTNKAI